MTATTQLIPRDLPIPQGRRLRFTFTVEYEVSVDEDLLGGEESATLQQIEEWLGAGTLGFDSESMFRNLANYDRNVLEHTAQFCDLASIQDAEHETRFEVDWEQRARANGDTAAWPSRVWLDALPPSAGASA